MTNTSIFIYCTHPDVVKDWSYRSCGLCSQTWDSARTEAPKAAIGFIDAQELKGVLEAILEALK